MNILFELTPDQEKTLAALTHELLPSEAELNYQKARRQAAQIIFDAALKNLMQDRVEGGKSHG
jgi:hypothetical protein